MKKTSTTVRTARDGALIRMISGRKTVVKSAKGRAMSEDQVRAAALSDPDNPPLTERRIAKMKAVPRVRTLRRALSLTQEEFAARYHIPLGTLRDWEQARSEPDQPARAYLMVIARDPEHVRKALLREPA